MRAASVPLLVALAAAVAHADSSETKERSVTQVADGVYVIRHPDAPDTFPQGNTTVVIGKREVLVVDSCYLPSDARKDIAQIRQWTKLPVRYLVNTHWHYDHTMGNGTYVAAFPGISVIAHKDTAAHIAGYNPGWFERFPKRAQQLQQIADSGKDGNGKVLDADGKAEYARAAAGVAKVVPEFKAIVDHPPDTSFEKELRLDVGGREVVLLHLGRGNTSGDAVVWLPKERVVVAGDLVDHPVPYLGGGYPMDEVVTLRELARLDFQTLVPGHGDVLRGEAARAFLALETDFIDTVVKQVSKEVYRVGNGAQHYDEVRKATVEALDVAGWRKKFGGDSKADGDFFESFSLEGCIKAAFADLNRR